MKKVIKISVRFIGVIILVVILLRTDWRALSTVFSDINFIKLIPVYLLIIPKGILVTYRWHLLLKKISIKRTYWDNIKLYYSSILIGFITPGRVGELYSVIRFSKKGYSKIKGAFSVFLPRFFDISFIFLLSIFSFNFLFRYTDVNKNAITKITWAGLLIIFFIYLVIFVFKNNFVGIVEKILKKVFRTDIDKSKILENVQKLDLNLFINLGLLTIIFWLLHFFQIYLLGKVLGIDIGYMIMVLVLAIVTLSAALPITIIGLGTREFAMINCLMVFGVAREVSLALSLLIYTFFIFDGLISTFLWHLEHKHD